MKINAIITAGGTSSRFGNTNKLLEKINGKEVIRYAVEAFLASNVDKIIICANVAIIAELEKIFSNGKWKVESGKSSLERENSPFSSSISGRGVSEDDGEDVSEDRMSGGMEVWQLSEVKRAIRQEGFIEGKKFEGQEGKLFNNSNFDKNLQKPQTENSHSTIQPFNNSNDNDLFAYLPICLFTNDKKLEIIQGGSTRQESVYNGLRHSKCDYVLIHDGARPMITTDLINQTIEMVKDKKALTVATKTIDTIKEVVDGKIIRTIDRSKLYNTQTPQAFEYNLIKQAHEKLKGQNYTDDAGMLEALGYDVYIAAGSYKNIKITTHNDIDIAKIYLSE